MDKKKLYIFIRNSNNPSDYYRIFQYIENLKTDYDVSIICSFPLLYHKLLGLFSRNKAMSFTLKSITYVLVYFKLLYGTLKVINGNNSVLFIQREIFPRRITFFQKKILNRILSKNKIIWDFDDNIVEINEISKYEFNQLSKYSSSILVCNNFLSRIIDLSYQSKVRLLPTSDVSCKNIDLFSLNQKRNNSYNKLIILIWLGTFNNLKYLETIIDEVDLVAKILKEKFNKEIVLNLISDSYFENRFKNLKINNIKWSRDRALYELKIAHIGLMPLDDNKITKGKCAFKAVQYMGFGIPVIASGVGFNKEVIEHNKNGFLIYDKNEWNTSLLNLSTDLILWNEFSLNSREKWLKNFNTENILANIKFQIG